MTSKIEFKEAYAELQSDAAIAADTIRRVFDAILAGEWTPVQVGAFISSLRLRGETASMIAAAAEAMRGAMVRVEHGLGEVLDTCGTGGDGAGTLNLSTGAALIAAAAGAPVAKHGNRAVSSQAGSADVLEALGVAIDLSPGHAAAVLEQANIVFLFAPNYHPAMRHAAQPRRELGIRTIFNCLGPLANPASATHQLIGAYDDSLRRVLAETLNVLGTQRAWIVRSEDGLDEVSPAAKTRVTQLSGGSITEMVVAPEDFGLKRLELEDIRGSDAAANARVLERVLTGGEHPSRDAFVLNAAAALVVAKGLEPRAAAARAREAIESGAATETLERWRAASQRTKA